MSIDDAVDGAVDAEGFLEAAEMLKRGFASTSYRRKERSVSRASSLAAEGQSPSPPVDEFEISTEASLQGMTDKAFGCNAPGCEGTAFSCTSDLKAHWRAQHPDIILEKRYRCALPNCSRTYKNINGIAYHVVAAQRGEHDTLKTRGRPSKLSTLRTDGKVFVCPIPGCDCSYRQVSGLRYHLVRHDPPVTIDEIKKLDPSLAARLRGRGAAFDKALAALKNGDQIDMDSVDHTLLEQNGL